jgi:hypothetical protein
MVGSKSGDSRVVTDNVWVFGEIVNLIDATGEKHGKRGPHKKRTA